MINEFIIDNALDPSLARASYRAKLEDAKVESSNDGNGGIFMLVASCACLYFIYRKRQQQQA